VPARHHYEQRTNVPIFSGRDIYIYRVPIIHGVYKNLISILIDQSNRLPFNGIRALLRSGLFAAIGRSKRLALLCILLFAVVTADGQNINRPMVNRLLSQLQRSKADSSRIRTLIELGKFHVYKPGESRVDLDSALGYLRQARKLSDSLHSLVLQHEVESMFIIAEMEGGDSRQGQSRFLRLIQDCRRTNDRAGEANARLRMGIWLRNIDADYHPVITQFQQAAALYGAINQRDKAVQALREIAITHLYRGKLDSAEAELKDVLRRYQSIGYPNLHYTYDNLAEINRLKGNFDQALYYSLLCIDSMRKTGDTLSAAAFYGDLARIYVDIGDHQKGVEWYQKSLTQWRKEKLPNFALYNTAGFLVKDLIQQRKPREALHLFRNLVAEIPTNTFIQKACVAQNLAYCYEALHNYPLAEQYYKETLYWYAKNKMDFEASQQAEEDIGVFYFNQKRFREAKDHLTKALNFLPQKNAFATLRDIHYKLFQVDSAQGNYLEAIRQFRLHKSMNDSLFNELKSKQIASLQIQYDTRTKEQNIDLLTKKSELQQAALKRGETARNAIIAGALLLAGLLGVSYNQYRLKQRNNQLLQAKQLEINQKNESLQHVLIEKEALLEEKEWMLKEIHHRVKNNLQVITSLLNAQSDFLQDPAALAAIRESQNRVHVMALIHQKLYQSDQLDQVDMAYYIDQIVAYLLESFDSRSSVEALLNVSPIALEVGLATPLGLIINEAVTNSLKYAFPQNRRGRISITLSERPQNTYQLTIGDNGVGLPADLNIHQSDTLGLTMIQGLSRQIGGQLSIDDDGGVQIILSFSTTKKAGQSAQVLA